MARKRGGKVQKSVRKQGQVHRRLWMILGGVMLVVALVVAWPWLRPPPPVIAPGPDIGADSPLRSLLLPLLTRVEAEPRKATAHGELGLAYEANERLAEAGACYENALRLAPEDWRWRLHLGIVLRDGGDFVGALDVFRALAQERPGTPAVQQHLGHAAAEMGDLETAEAAYRRLTEESPQLPHGYAGLGDVLLQQGKLEEAVAVLGKAVRKGPSYRMAHYLLGTAYQRQGRADEARQSLVRGADAVYEFMPDPLTARMQRYILEPGRLVLVARNYLEHGNPGAAMAVLEQVLRTHPDRGDVLNNLAVVYLEQGAQAEAGRLLQRARGLPESSAETYTNLALWALRGRQLEASLAYADTAVARSPEWDAAHLARAQALMQLGRAQEALAAGRAALERGAFNPRAFGLVGDLAYQLEAYELARENLEQAVSLAPDLVPAWVRLAQVHWALGDRQAARTALDEAKKRAPDYPLIARVEQFFLSE